MFIKQAIKGEWIIYVLCLDTNSLDYRAICDEFNL